MKRGRPWRSARIAASGFLLLLLMTSAAYASSGSVEGLAYISSVQCANSTTGQQVRLEPTDTTYDCEAGGFEASEGDFIQHSILGKSAVNTAGINGSVTGMTQVMLLYCRNWSTRRSVWQWFPQDFNWNCSDLGFRVSPGQKIEIRMWGYAQGPLPPAPSGLAAQAGVGEAILSWEAIPDATHYNVYMSSEPGVTPSRDFLQASVATIEHAVTGLTNDVTYYFVVTAVNAYGEGDPSVEVSVTPGFFDHSTVAGQPCSNCHVGGRATSKPPTHPLTSNLCEACHTTIQWVSLITPFDHSQTVDLCARCHNGAIAAGMPGSHPATTNNCGACHSTAAWLPVLMDHNEIAGSCSGSGCHSLPSGHCSTADDCGTCHTTTSWATAQDCATTPSPPPLPTPLPTPAPPPPPPPPGSGGGMGGGSMGGGGGGGLPPPPPPAPIPTPTPTPTPAPAPPPAPPPTTGGGTGGVPGGGGGGAFPPPPPPPPTISGTV
jgi:hypothetical protein